MWQQLVGRRPLRESPRQQSVMLAIAGDEGKGRGEGEQLLIARLRTLDQGVFHCTARTLKIELGASTLEDRKSVV